MCPADRERAQAEIPAEAFLVDVVGLDPKQLRKVKKCWDARGGAAPSAESCSAVVDFLLSDEVNIPKENLPQFLADAPEVMDVFSVETLREKVRFLRDEALISAEDLTGVVSAYPQVLIRSVPDTLRPALQFWAGVVGIPRQELGALLQQIAAQAWCRPETLRPKWRFAVEVMGLDLKDLLQCDVPYFRLSLDKTVAPRHFFLLRKKLNGKSLNEMVKPSDADFAKKVACCEPDEYYAWLQDEWPISDEARTLSWIQPVKKRRPARGAWRGSRYPPKRQQSEDQQSGWQSPRLVTDDQLEPMGYSRRDIGYQTE